MVRMKRCAVGCLLPPHVQNPSAFLAPRVGIPLESCNAVFIIFTLEGT